MWDDEESEVGGPAAQWANPGNPVEPWHIWGTSIRLTATVDSATTVGSVGAQLLKVSYKRPETWSYFLGARIVGARTAAGSPLSTGCTVDVRYNLMTGIGRTMFQTSDQLANFAAGAGLAFARFRWVVPAGPGTNLLLLPAKWTTVTRTPLHDDSDPTSFERIETFPAQDIQMSSQLLWTTVDQEMAVDVEVTAYVAPRTHIRPDWFAANAQRKFLGGETGGT